MQVDTRVDFKTRAAGGISMYVFTKEHKMLWKNNMGSKSEKAIVNVGNKRDF